MSSLARFNIKCISWLVVLSFVCSIVQRKMSLLAVKAVILFKLCCTVSKHSRTITFLAAVALLIDRKASAKVVLE